MDEIAFTTAHGSHLYGLAHAGSDRDYMVVYNDSRRAVHKVNGSEDVVRVGIYDLVEKAQGGSHQFLEGVFSQQKEWQDETFRPFLEALRVPGSSIAPKYIRTIKRLCHDDFKFRRHAVRLSFFLDDLREFGRASPTLSAERIERANELATLHKEGDLFRVLMGGT